MARPSGMKSTLQSIVKPIVVSALIGSLIVPSFAQPTKASAASQPASKLEQKSDDPITAGARLRSYTWTTTRGGKSVSVDMKAVVIDLQNPNVKLDVMTGSQNQFTKKQSVRGMATETGAVAGINGDFFNTQAEGVPLGPEIANGKVMSTPPLYSPGYYSFAITADNKPVIDTFSFDGTIRAKDGATYPLSGVNKSYYYFESSDPAINGQHSHTDSIYLYTSTWGQEVRAIDRETDLTEILVQNGIITQIAKNDMLHMIAPPNGYILRTEGAGAQFALTHFKVGDPVYYDYTIKPDDTSAAYDPKQLKMMIGGQTILVDKGQPSAFSRSDVDVAGYRSRTAVGYTQDQRYAYLVTADRSATSAGMSLSDFQQALTQMGLYRAMNLDGGGSTQMVARPYGETSVALVNQTENGNERQIVNGLGVYSLAPQGQVKSVFVSGDQALLAGEKATYTLKAVDEYDNPITVDPTQAQWSVTPGKGSFDKNVYTPAGTGPAQITVTLGNAKQTFDVQILTRNDIASMTIQPSSTILLPNSDITLNVLVKTKTGVQKLASGSLFQWETKGITGQLLGSNLHVDAADGNTAQLIARYDGFSTIQPMTVGYTKLWADFDNLVPGTPSFIGTAGVTGNVYQMSGIPGASGKALNLQYDMRQGSGTRAAYIAFGDNGSGLSLEGEPQTLMMNVNGDNSLNWLRAQFIDAGGQMVYVDLARTVNWSGWKNLSIDLTSYKLKYPVKLTRIYAASVEQGQDERTPVGSISIDDISLQYKLPQPAPAAKNQIKISIDKLDYTVNGNTQTMDQAPVIVKDNTLVPVRFVVEALGGTVDWDNNERKATIRYGAKLIDIWLDNPDLIANGARVTAEVTPQLMNERTMVPLRILAENLGWKVTWDNDTRSVILQ